MKAMDLLVGFGSVKDSYVISAEEFRQEKQKAQVQVPVHTENVADRRCDCADATFGRLCCGICAAFTGYENW